MFQYPNTSFDIKVFVALFKRELPNRYAVLSSALHRLGRRQEAAVQTYVWCNMTRSIIHAASATTCIVYAYRAGAPLVLLYDVGICKFCMPMQFVDPRTICRD